MSLLNVRYAVTNADVTAFIYVKLGRPEESPLPMVSGMSDTMQGAQAIIATFRRGVAKQIVLAYEELAHIVPANTTYPIDVPARRKRKEDWIKRLEAMESAVYHVVEIQHLVVV
jgi:hypothetical protein